MTRLLTRQEKLAAARAWSQVFKSTDPFGWPFEDAISSGRLLYPTDGCHLFADQLQALRFAALEAGDSACYLAVVEGKATLAGSDEERVYALNLDDFDGYSQLNLTLENAIFSASGSWGLLISHEMHAVIGGARSFIAAFDEIDLAAEEQWKEFKEEWRADRHKHWLDRLASHVQR